MKRKGILIELNCYKFTSLQLEKKILGKNKVAFIGKKDETRLQNLIYKITQA